MDGYAKKQNLPGVREYIIILYHVTRSLFSCRNLTIGNLCFRLVKHSIRKA